MHADNENHRPPQSRIEFFETEIAPLPRPHPEHFTRSPHLWTPIIIIGILTAAAILAVAINIAQTPQIT